MLGVVLVGLSGAVTAVGEVHPRVI